MQQRTMQKAAQTAKKNNKRRVWQKIIGTLACVVVFCTTYALILPAVTQEASTSCGMEEHTHTEECYGEGVSETLICTLSEAGTHVHTDECYVTVETQAATEGHTHSDACYTTTQGELVCQTAEAEGHSHTDGCYSSALTCTDTSEEHSHSDACYETSLTCGKEESAGHTHSSDCYAQEKTLTCGKEETAASDAQSEKVLVCTEEEAHVHSDACYASEPELICGMEEHAHTLSCFADPSADVESAETWEKSFNKKDLTGVWAQDVVTIAKSQLGYTESEKNYIVVTNDDGEEVTKGYTRYGDWYGDPYGDWCAMFASFCLNYAEVEDMPLSSNCQNWIEALSEDEVELYHPVNLEDMDETERYQPEAGDLIFYDWDQDGTADHVGIVTEIITKTIENMEVPDEVKAIEGNSSDRVQYVTYDLDDEDIMGYGALPAQPTAYTYSDDAIQVAVVLPENTTVPLDAVLKVTPVESDAANYDSMVQEAENAVSGQINQIALYDISFYTENGSYLPVDETARVTMRFADAVVDAAADVQVLHYDENDENPILLEEVTVDEDSVVEFETEGFSTFAVIELTSMYQTVGITGLEGKSFIIAGVNWYDGTFEGNIQKALPVLTSEKDGGNMLAQRQTASVVYTDNKVTSVALTDYSGAVWTFEQAHTGTYYIKNSDGQYLSIPDNGRLTLSDDQQEFRVVAATGFVTDIGDATNAVCIEADVNGNTYRVNVDQNNSQNNFSSWNGGTGDKGNHLVLVEYTEPQPITLTDLAGKSYIIAAVNFNGANNTGNNFNDDGTRKALPVMTSEIITDKNNDNTSLQKRLADSFVYSASGNVTSVTLTDYTNAVWTFENAGDGTYYIKISGGYYLSIKSGDNSLTLENTNEPQKFRVVAATEANVAGDAKNAVCIETDVDGTKYRVNLAANDIGRDFTSWDSGVNDRGNHLVLIEYTEHQIEMPVIAPATSDDGTVNNLAGKKIVITNNNNGNGNGNAITGTTLNVGNENEFDDRLDDMQVTVAADKSTVTISSKNSADLVWEFEAAKDKEGNIITGQYYIKHVATGKYLHIYNESQADDKPLTLTDADNKQAIEVLSAKDTNNPNAVWFRFPKLLYTDEYDNDPNNNNDYNAIDHYGDGFGVWNKSSANPQNQFLLSEYTDLPMMDAVDATVAANNLNGMTMVITVPTSNVVLTNKSVDGNKLQAQAAKENNGVLSITSDTSMAEVKWTFTSASETDPSQYYIQDANGKYLNIVGVNVTLTDDENRQAITVSDAGNGTVVFSVVQDGKTYLLDLYAADNAFGAWERLVNKAGDNNKLKLTPVEQFDQDSAFVTNLDGKTLALISIYDANPKKEEAKDYTPKLALTSQAKDNGLQGVEVELSVNTGEAYTFDDTKFTDNNELWTFEAVENKLGVYYIKAANGKYLNLGDETAVVSDTKQEITVLSDTYTGPDGITYEVVYLRATVDGKDVYLRREFNGYEKKLFGDDTVDNEIKQRNFVLAQTSTIYIDVYKGLDLNNEAWLYKPQLDDQGTTFKEVAVIGGGNLPTSGELNAEPEDHVRGTNPTQHFVSFYFAESMDPYTAGKGRDFPQAYMASWAPKLDANGNGYIDPKERGDTNGDGKVDNEDDPADKDTFINTLKDAVYDPDFKGESPYWGVEYELTHYEVTLPDGSTLKDTSGNNAKFAPGAEYSVTNDGKIAITDVNGAEYKVPFGSTFKAQYSEFSDILTFYINLYGVVADTAADIQPRYIEDFTLGLAIAHVYYPGKYAGDTTEDYNKTNEYINSLFKGAYGENVEPGVMHAVIDGFITRSGPENRGDALYDQNKQRFLSNEMTPALGASATALAAHVLDYVRTVPDVDIMLKNYVSGNGENTPTLNNQTIDTATFEVRWYVVKEQGDSWHIDGVTIGKTEPIPVTKTFYGLPEDDVNGRVNYERSNDTNISGETHYTPTNNYQIGVSISDGTNSDGTNYIPYYNMQPYDQEDWDKTFNYTVTENNAEVKKTCQDPNLNPAIDNLYTYNGGPNPYNWTMSAILKQSYKLDEQNYEFDGYDRVSKVTVKDKDGTSTDTFGTSAYVTGGTTASVEFNNYYTKNGTGMFIVKKISSVTGLPLAGAKFTLYDSIGEALYTETTDADGEASFYNLGDGTYYLRETKAPDGFTATKTEWKIEVANEGKVTYEGNAESGNVLYDFKEGNGTTFKPLEITNAPDKQTVKVIKQFVGISKDQVDSLAQNYSIVMKPNETPEEGQHYGSYTLKLTGNEGATPVVSADGLTYTWTLTDVPEIEYTVKESQFKLKNYVTTVSVEGFKDDNYTTSVTEPVVADNTATFTATFNEEHEDGFTIYNSYANDFSMQITKVDSTTVNDKEPKYLSGATFEVYGDHYITTDTNSETSKSITVGNRTLYKLGEVKTGSDGTVTFNGWTDTQGVFHKLVLGYPYALVETKAPDGYNLLTEPIYLGVVNAEGVTDLDKEANPNLVFSNGVYSITVENQPGYELPEAGGSGTLLYTLGGTFLLALPPVVYGYDQRRRRERRGEQ